MLKTYLKKINEIFGRGDAREESYYSLLKELIDSYSELKGKTRIHVTILPKKTEAGNPDFRIWNGKQQIVGYIEAKAPTIGDLDKIEHTDQLKRYLYTFPNVILTNFFEFRLYRNGLLIDNTFVARPFIVHKLRITPPVENESNFFNLIEKFLSFSLPKVYNAKTLAIELAKRTRFLKEEVISEELKEEETSGKGHILGFYEAFRKYLISGLKKEEFADLYSQTVSYGLFAARTRSENGFNRKLAYDSIPHTIGILRDLFKFISLEDIPEQMEWIIDEISEVLAVTDVTKILHQYFHEGKGKDPIIHFYETFLAEYDPKTRKKCGVYFTPEPVVSYIVRSLHTILKNHFNRTDGFASDTVTVLDPAAGTLTFLAEAAKLALEEFVSKYGEGGREDFIKEHILNNFYAFELMMAPYAVGHLKMSFLLEELGYKLQGDDRFKLYLTNTLEMEELAQTELPGMASLSEESHFAGKIKKEKPILVILGNPPYSVSSVNKSDFIEKEMELYKEDVRDERNIQPLSDDYIKFIRFAHWKIEKTGEGIIGIITNNSYLSGLIHRGMRKKLFQSFQEIYILNLHGNSRIGEKCPDGSKDENVFDIQQGVTIALYVKVEESHKERKIYYADLWGLRGEKYDYLLKNDVETTKWQELKLAAPYYFFIPKDFALQGVYEKFWKVTDIFRDFQIGLMTGQDKFFIDTNPQTLKARILAVFNKGLSDKDLKTLYNLKSQAGEKTIKARRLTSFDQDLVHLYCYRPFDIRYVYGENKFLWRSVESLSKHFDFENIALVTTRILAGPPFNHVFVAEHAGDNTFISGKTKERNYFFPLYLYQVKDKKDLFINKEGISEKKPNIILETFAFISDTYKKEPSPEDIFYYIYAILYSNIYRTKYAEFLKIDFPRIPFTKDYKLFSKIFEYGKRLVDLHLLKSEEFDTPIARFQGKGDNEVDKLRYDDKQKRLYFNRSQYFEGVTEEIWKYQIGSYKVCDKWLKDRKGRILNLGDIKHYCKVVTALKKTIEIQKEIDKLYPKIEEKIIEFKTDHL